MSRGLALELPTSAPLIQRERVFLGITPDDNGAGLRSLRRIDTLGRDADRRDSSHRHGSTAEPPTLMPTPGGIYADAIQRWESITRPAPEPTEPAVKGGRRLSARFDEWHMGLPDGWITDVPEITYQETIGLCGNGVVPQQAAAAVSFLLDVLGERMAA